ncbi:hypothetical protein NECAME_08698 [Necator americanus]|uniref:Uncharacterized protein n=1 Tax=Necator americanus TaxID=51031 RepID=W2THB7_NECAM|nr:hypothetical protein NECAME_08698 [Necator americanus]ETN81218.1 hypothetical protein NECAME_08698 [Necator americanus]
MQLPVLALNEVFIGESLSSRVSYYEIQIDNSKMVKQKSSGIAICTGLPLSPLQGLASSDVSSWFLAARAAHAGVSAQEFREHSSCPIFLVDVVHCGIFPKAG